MTKKSDLIVKKTRVTLKEVRNETFQVQELMPVVEGVEGTVKLSFKDEGSNKTYECSTSIDVTKRSLDFVTVPLARRLKVMLKVDIGS